MGDMQRTEVGNAGSANYFFADRPFSSRERWLTGIAVLLVFLLAQLVVNPAWGGWLRPRLASISSGPRVFLHHVLVYSLGRTLVCGALLVLLIRRRVFQPLTLRRKVRVSLLQGTVAGIMIALLPLAVAVPRGHVPGLRFNGWLFAGNLFSNAWEELVFRGLVFTAVLLVLRRSLPAALLSGLIFGLSHMQYHPLQQVYVGMIGAYLALLYYHTGNLLGPWVAHQLSDTLLDSLQPG